MSIGSKTRFFDELNKHLKESVDKIITPDNIDILDENISYLAGFQYIDYFNLSILSGEYYFIKEEEINKLIEQLKKLLYYFSDSTNEKVKEKKKSVIDILNVVNPILKQFIELLDYTKMENNRKIVKPVYRIENIIEKYEKTDLYLFQINILLAEIDHDIHVSEEIEKKLNIIEKSLENQINTKDPVAQTPIIEILLDKTKLFLYKIYSRKIKIYKKFYDDDDDSHVVEKDILIEKTKEIKKSLEKNNYYSDFLN